MKSIFSYLINEISQGTPITYSTIIKTRGSAPQIPGASAIINEKGLAEGTLGGGIMEAEIQIRAQESISSKKDDLIEYDLDADIKDNSGPICGGYATILVDSHPEDFLYLFEEIHISLRNNQPGHLITIIDLDKRKDKIISRYWISRDAEPDITLSEKYYSFKQNIAEVRDAQSPQCITSVENNELVFIEFLCPDPRLIIVGAGHIGKALSHFGKRLDFHVTVIDDRSEFANQINIPDADVILTNGIEKDLASYPVNDNSYVVLVTQGHKKDSIALQQVIHSSAAYIGMIGSKRKTRLMKRDFIQNNWATKEDLDQIYAPIGINIGSKTVQEIALSIAAQLVEVRQQKSDLKKKSVGCIILAAGLSSRMKQQKLVMPYGDDTIIKSITDKAVMSKAEEIVVVLGSDAEDVKKALEGLPVDFEINKNYKDGMLSSVQCGFNSLPGRLDAAVLLLGDQPMLPDHIIDQLIEVYREGMKSMVVPVYKGKRGHPILIDLKYLDEINQIDPEVGLRELMLHHEEEIFELEVDTSDILKDIDTYEDYKKELT